MSIQWLWVTGIRKTFSFLFCFSNSSRWSATLLHTTNCKGKSSLHAPVNTTHAGPEATTLKNSVLVCCESKHGQQDIYFSPRSSQIFSSHKIQWESNSWNHGKFVPFFLALTADSLYRSCLHPIWPQTIVEKRRISKISSCCLSGDLQHGHAHWTDFVSVCAMNEDFLASFC